jgi:polysaccharide deacetylase 2 family uncharacterized protein YibQ
MGAGVLSGVFWGLVVSAIAVILVSLSVPLPQQPGEAGTPPAVETTAQAPAPEPAEPEQEEPAPQTVASGESPSETDEPAQPAVPPALAALEGAQPGPSLDRETGGAVSSIPLPAGSEFNRPPPEEAPVLPQTDAAPGMQAPEVAQPVVPEAPGGVETAPAPLPEIATAPEAVAPAQLDAADATPPEVGRDTPAAPVAVSPLPLVRPEPDAVATAEAESVAPPALVVAEPAPEAPEEEIVAEATEQATEQAAEQSTEQAAEQVAEAPQPAPVDAEPEAPPADEAQEVAADESPEAPAAPPVVVQLVPPQESAPLAMLPLDDLPVGDAWTDAATDAGEDLPEPPRLMRPGDAEGAEAAPRTLPQIVSPARNVPEGGEGAGADLPVADLQEELPPAEAADAADGPALVAFAAPFDPAETRPLIAVILIDEPDDRLDIETLTRFSFPVAFAIDPSRPDATERAAIYRAAGFEVLMLASLIPEGATASDTEVALSVARDRVPEAIAIMDTPESRVQSERVVLEAAVGVAARTGQGFVAFPRGLNTAEQMAERADVPATTLFRLLDDEDQRATVITRFLGRAEFAAAQEGAVIVAGRTRPDTVTALFSWALGDRNEGVAIAPVSAVLQRLAEDG